jgi:dolichol-phosphate mannosyltransferase
MNKLIEKILKIEFIRYGMVGVVSTVIDYIFLNLSHLLMRNSDNTLWLATAIGFCAGLINGYFMNSRWTFKYKTEGREVKKFSQFAIISLVGLGLTELIVLEFTSNGGLSKNIAKLIAVAVVFFWNYFGNKFWTFRENK